ncbi:MAG: DNA repair protein RecO [Planctomycetota bacterium]|nr:MAG: DNA repair protein RecO [Planctomycetota bacterium]
MPRVTTEALVLRRTPFGETSQIAVFLTRSHGRVPLILKGVHRPRSRKGGGVDLFDHCRLTWASRKGSRAMAQLVERRLLSHHPALRSRTDLMAAGDCLGELLLGLLPEGQRLPRALDLSLAFLAALEARPAPPALATAVFALQGGMLRLTGFEPTLDRCVMCERRPEAHHLLRVDLVRGGIVCSGCRDGQDHSFSLSAAAARVVRGLTGRDPRSLSDVTLPAEIEAQVRRCHERMLAHVLERAPRCRLPAPAA